MKKRFTLGKLIITFTVPLFGVILASAFYPGLSTYLLPGLSVALVGMVLVWIGQGSSMKVNEIFHSISGEGAHAGIPAVFVRLAGCNLACSYCDTQYAQKPEQGVEMSVDEILRRVREFREDGWVLITGGEPLSQDIQELVGRLRSRGYRIEVETNGSFSPPLWASFVSCWSVDVKCPSSGPSYGSFNRKWLRRLRKQDQLKFVVDNEEDLGFVEGLLRDAKLRPTVLISPVFGQDTAGWLTQKEWLQRCAEFCKEQNVRLSLQLHKIVWGEKKGV